METLVSLHEVHHGAQLLPEAWERMIKGSPRMGLVFREHLSMQQHIVEMRRGDG